MKKKYVVSFVISLALSAFSQAAHAGDDAVLSVCVERLAVGMTYSDSSFFTINGTDINLATDPAQKDIQEIRWHADGQVEAIRYEGSPDAHTVINIGKGPTIPAQMDEACQVKQIVLPGDRFDVSIKKHPIRDAIPAIGWCGDKGPCTIHFEHTTLEITDRNTGETRTIESEIKHESK